MIIELTVDQQQALSSSKDSPPRMVNPSTHVEYVLIRKDQYESVASALEEERRESIIREIAFEDATKRFLEEE